MSRRGKGLPGWDSEAGGRHREAFWGGWLERSSHDTRGGPPGGVPGRAAARRLTSGLTALVVDVEAPPTCPHG